jgi:hypothetical protein
MLVPVLRQGATEFNAARFSEGYHERMPGTPIRGESGCQAPPVNATIPGQHS